MTFTLSRMFLRKYTNCTVSEGKSLMYEVLGILCKVCVCYLYFYKNAHLINSKSVERLSVELRWGRFSSIIITLMGVERVEDP